MTRCPWAKSELMMRYHDCEWGVPARSERVLFEFLILEGAQAGLSWQTILAKRENYRLAFDGFDAEKIARYTPKKIDSLLKDPGIVRNRLKIDSAVGNARAFLNILDERGKGGFTEHLWSFVGGEPVVNRWREPAQVPARSPASDAMSKDLMKRDFRFVGTTICYAFMQATGMVNDHLVSCRRHGEIVRAIKGGSRR